MTAPQDPSASPPDAAEIAGFVRAFYGRVQHHPELGPVFARRISDWEPHLARMTAFWTAVLHGVPAYTPSPRGGPPVLHRAIEELRRAHFDTWLGLFEETLVEQLGADRAAPVMARARRMARALSAHLPLEDAPLPGRAAG